MSLLKNYYYLALLYFFVLIPNPVGDIEEKREQWRCRCWIQISMPSPLQGERWEAAASHENGYNSRLKVLFLRAPGNWHVYKQSVMLLDNAELPAEEGTRDVVLLSRRGRQLLLFGLCKLNFTGVSNLYNSFPLVFNYLWGWPFDYSCK